jgi:hypothetical protein
MLRDLGPGGRLAALFAATASAVTAVAAAGDRTPASETPFIGWGAAAAWVAALVIPGGCAGPPAGSRLAMGSGATSTRRTPETDTT